MSERDRKRLKEIQTFPALVKYLREELGWPVEQGSFDDMDEITFDWEADELGIDPDQAAKIEYIKQLRPLENGQPQGVFFVKFNNKNLPVVALRRLLGKLVVKKRATAAAAERPLWAMRDLVFISSYGESTERQLSFAYFQEPEHKSELPSLKVLGWDDRDTALHLDRVHDQLAAHLTWPESAKALPTWRKGWSAAFELRHGEIVTTAKQLAEQLAALARGIRERANQLLKLETESGPLRTLMAGFKTALIHDLTEDQFAAMYAQTIAYGLLSARITHPDPVKAETLPDLIPVTNPFLKELMETFVLAGGKHRGRKRGHHLDFDELGINDVVELLRRANMDAVLRNFGADDRREDPVTYFYEDFLNAYDPKERKSRGVYYTPKPVVSYIVRSVHELLKTEFGLEDGLASTVSWGEMAKRHNDLKIPAHTASDSPFVQILDPATGTATFLVTVIEVIYDTLGEKWKKQGLSEAQRTKAWNDYVPKHLLPRLYGYELMMAPYAVAHLKIGLSLFATGYRFESVERARIYLTNALEPASDGSYSQIDALSEALAHEAEAVNAVKRTQSFSVIVGNPPYAVESMNSNSWIDGLMDTYREEVGDEQNIQLLSDDFAKFLRLADHLIVSADCGLFGLITKNTFINTTAFRGLRRHLYEAFDKVCVLDLRGKLYGKTSNGKPDTNFFPIRVGVAITLGWRLSDSSGKDTFLYHEMEGLGEEKLRCLSTMSFASTPWTEQQIDQRQWVLEPRARGEADEQAIEEYEEFAPLLDIAIGDRPTDYQGSLWGGGVKTNRDYLLVAIEKIKLEERLELLASTRTSNAEVKQLLGLEDGSYWNTERERRKLRALNWRSRIVPYLYGPFDIRWVAHIPQLIEIGRGGASKHLMQHFQAERNLGLVLKRRNLDDNYHHVFVTRATLDINCLGGQTYVVPLRHAGAQGGQQLSIGQPVGPRDNFNTALARAISGRTNEKFCSDSVFSYVYSILHSPTYRVRYGRELRKEFPRIPVPRDSRLFESLSDLGSQLVACHLLEQEFSEASEVAYVGPRNAEVGRVGWSDGTVWLDAAATKKGQPAEPGTIGFHGVPEAVWNFHIGGYQVCEKWLKDRKGRKLLKADIEHYQKMVVALSETIRIMKEIDEVIEAHGGWPGAFRTGEAGKGTKN
jgi:hypothetical protein